MFEPSRPHSKMVLSLFALLSILLAGQPTAGAAGGGGPVITQLKGRAVRLAAPDAATGEPARPLQLLAPGSALRLDERAEAVLICPDDTLIRLIGPRRWTAPAGGCPDGGALAPGSYRLLMARGGQVRAFGAHLLTEPPSRGGDDAGKVPILLAPRSPQRRAVMIGEAAPAISWMAVAEALTYRLTVERGRGDAPPVELAARTVRCVPDPRSAPYRACTVLWPWEPLAEGETAKLAVVAVTRDPDWRERRADPARLQLAPAGKRRQVELLLQPLADAGLPAATRELLRAAVYEEHSLDNEAAAALLASVEESPQAAVAVRLADVQLGLGLLHAALRSYSKASQLLPPRGEDEVRAAIELGLGRAYGRQEKVALAQRHLARCERLYRQLGLQEQAAQAAEELASLRASQGLR